MLGQMVNRTRAGTKVEDTREPPRCGIKVTINFEVAPTEMSGNRTTRHLFSTKHANSWHPCANRLVSCGHHIKGDKTKRSLGVVTLVGTLSPTF